MLSKTGFSRYLKRVGLLHELRNGKSSNEAVNVELMMKAADVPLQKTNVLNYYKTRKDDKRSSSCDTSALQPVLMGNLSQHDDSSQRLSSGSPSVGSRELDGASDSLFQSQSKYKVFNSEQDVDQRLNPSRNLFENTHSYKSNEMETADLGVDTLNNFDVKQNINQSVTLMGHKIRDGDETVIDILEPISSFSELGSLNAIHEADKAASKIEKTSLNMIDLPVGCDTNSISDKSLTKVHITSDKINEPVHADKIYTTEHSDTMFGLNEPKVPKSPNDNDVKQKKNIFNQLGRHYSDDQVNFLPGHESFSTNSVINTSSVNVDFDKTIEPTQRGGYANLNMGQNNSVQNKLDMVEPIKRRYSISPKIGIKNEDKFLYKSLDEPQSESIVKEFFKGPKRMYPNKFAIARKHKIVDESEPQILTMDIGTTKLQTINDTNKLDKKDEQTNQEKINVAIQNVNTDLGNVNNVIEKVCNETNDSKSNNPVSINESNDFTESDNTENIEVVKSVCLQANDTSCNSTSGTGKVTLAECKNIEVTRNAETNDYLENNATKGDVCSVDVNANNLKTDIDSGSSTEFHENVKEEQNIIIPTKCEPIIQSDIMEELEMIGQLNNYKFLNKSRKTFMLFNTIDYQTVDDFALEPKTFEDVKSDINMYNISDELAFDDKRNESIEAIDADIKQNDNPLADVNTYTVPTNLQINQPNSNVLVECNEISNGNMSTNLSDDSYAKQSLGDTLEESYMEEPLNNNNEHFVKQSLQTKPNDEHMKRTLGSDDGETTNVNPYIDRSYQQNVISNSKDFDIKETCDSMDHVAESIELCNAQNCDPSENHKDVVINKVHNKSKEVFDKIEDNASLNTHEYITPVDNSSNLSMINQNESMHEMMNKRMKTYEAQDEALNENYKTTVAEMYCDKNDDVVYEEFEEPPTENQSMPVINKYFDRYKFTKGLNELNSNRDFTYKHMVNMHQKYGTNIDSNQFNNLDELLVDTNAKNNEKSCSLKNILNNDKNINLIKHEIISESDHDCARNIVHKFHDIVPKTLSQFGKEATNTKKETCENLYHSKYGVSCNDPGVSLLQNERVEDMTCNMYFKGELVNENTNQADLCGKYNTVPIRENVGYSSRKAVAYGSVNSCQGSMLHTEVSNDNVDLITQTGDTLSKKEEFIAKRDIDIDIAARNLLADMPNILKVMSMVTEHKSVPITDELTFLSKKYDEMIRHELVKYEEQNEGNQIEESPACTGGTLDEILSKCIVESLTNNGNIIDSVELINSLEFLNSDMRAKLMNEIFNDDS